MNKNDWIKITSKTNIIYIGKYYNHRSFIAFKVKLRVNDKFKDCQSKGEKIALYSSDNVEKLNKEDVMAILI